MNADIKSTHYLTIVTSGTKPGMRTYWFGRADMKDNLRPVKIEAPCINTAWKKLSEREKC